MCISLLATAAQAAPPDGSADALAEPAHRRARGGFVLEAGYVGGPGQVSALSGFAQHESDARTTLLWTAEERYRATYHGAFVAAGPRVVFGKHTAVEGLVRIGHLRLATDTRRLDSGLEQYTLQVKPSATDVSFLLRAFLIRRMGFVELGLSYYVVAATATFEGTDFREQTSDSVGAVGPSIGLGARVPVYRALAMGAAVDAGAALRPPMVPLSRTGVRLFVAWDSTANGGAP